MRHKGCGKLIHEDWTHASLVTLIRNGVQTVRREPRLFCECGEEIVGDLDIEPSDE